MEERKYETVESAGSAKAQALEGEAFDDGSPLGSTEYPEGSGSDSSDEFSWVQRLQHIPDKVWLHDGI